MKDRCQGDKYLVGAHAVPVGIKKLKQGIRLMQNSMRCWFTADVDSFQPNFWLMRGKEWKNTGRRKNTWLEVILDYWSAFDNRATLKCCRLFVLRYC